jgi:hypothetical protein
MLRRMFEVFTKAPEYDTNGINTHFSIGMRDALDLRVGHSCRKYVIFN